MSSQDARYLSLSEAAVALSSSSRRKQSYTGGLITGEGLVAGEEGEGLIAGGKGEGLVTGEVLCRREKGGTDCRRVRGRAGCRKKWEGLVYFTYSHDLLSS